MFEDLETYVQFLQEDCTVVDFLLSMKKRVAANCMEISGRVSKSTITCWSDMLGDAGGALVESASPLKTDPLTADLG